MNFVHGCAPALVVGEGAMRRFGFEGRDLDRAWMGCGVERGVVAFLRARWGGGNGREGLDGGGYGSVRFGRTKQESGKNMLVLQLQTFSAALGRGEGVLGWRWDRQRNE